MTEATPHLRRRSLLNASVASSPLRRSNVGAVTPAALFEPADDEQERFNRRSIVEIQRRLTNITTSSGGSPLVDLNPILDENQIKDHLRICTKLFTENRISAKNAWQLHVIDVMRKIVSTDSANILQVAGSSLDIGAKVYGLRVDDVHAKGLQLASSMAKSNEKQKNHEEDNIEVDMDSSTNAQKNRREVRKKTKKLAADKRNTIDKDKKNLFAPVKHIESVVFATKENIDVSATDNLFTHKLPISPASHQFMLLTDTKYWLRDSDEILDHGDKIIEIELPQITHYNLCIPFKEFETGTWDPEEEERLLAESANLPDVVLDDDGRPIPELDGSIHDIFEDNHDVAEDGDVEEQEVFQAQIHGEVAHIVDAVPEESRFETEYGYNTLIRTSSGKYIDKIWAGPSHWKVKFNRRSTARYSGCTVQQVVKHTRKHKVQQLIDFSTDDWDTPEKFVVKRAPRTTTFEKITLPVPESSFQNFLKIMYELLMKPGVRLPKLKNANINQQHDYEVQGYNYENPNDSLYCSQNNNNDGDEPIQHSFEDEDRVVPQQFSDDNLVNAPEIVCSSHIPYAMQAKKVDMKKLKGAVWTCLTQNSGDKDKDLKNFRPMKFSELCCKLPQLLSADMIKELTRPLTVVALLHLCNENNLILSQDNCKDFIINKAEK